MDERKDMLFIFIVFVLLGQSLPVPTPPKLTVCDDSRAIFFREGNIGESENFPWLGLLRVHLHEFDELKIAVTGLVLVKERFAIANSDDIKRIPKHVFMQDSKAMFIPRRGEPWYTKPKDYMVHPEFEFSTYNTIALIELEPEEGQTLLPFKPVCWPGNFFNTSNQLYALGYTDENKHMEKTMYSLQYVKPSLCKEFYSKAGVSPVQPVFSHVDYELNSEPTSVQCGFAEKNKNDCTWENGMALVSNSSGKWTLIGLSVRGPGCAAPARFLDMSSYFPWIESATDLEEIQEFPDYPEYRRKTAFNVGFRRSGQKVVATTERPAAFREQYPEIGPDGPGKFNIYTLDQGMSYYYEMPLHLAEAGFVSAEGCWAPKVLVYRESMKLVDTFESGGSLEYRVTVYDKHIYNYTCMKLKIQNVRSRFPVKVWFRDIINLIEGTGFKGEVGDTPLEIIKYYPLPPKFKKPDKNATKNSAWKPGKHLEAKFLVDKRNHSDIININIILGFTFRGNATMDLSVYGYPHRRSLRITTTEEPYRRFDENVINFARGPPRLAEVPQRHAEVPQGLPRMKRKNRLEKARERAAERKARQHTMRAYA